MEASASRAASTTARERPSATPCSSSGAPEHGFGRAGTDAEGRFAFLVPEGARRFELLVFARGLLKPGVTRLYLDDEGAEDPTLVARREDGVLRFDVRLQGDDATAFFQL